MSSQIKNQGTSPGGSNNTIILSDTKRVIDIILDSDHPKYTDPNSIGTIFFTDENSREVTKKPHTLPIARPISRNTIIYPLKGEIVQVIQSTSNDYYKDMEGNPNNITNYYYPPLNIHSTTTNNALPNQGIFKRKNKASNDTTISTNIPNFQFESEFISEVQEVANKKLNNYLFNLGFTSGRNDPRAPTYTLFQQSNGKFVYRLDDSKENKIKLGNYFKENPNQRPLTPTEGDLIIEGRNGQRFRATITGPEGKNTISNNVTDVEDGNTSMGDPAILISVGEGENENINLDGGSIYVLKNQSVNIVVASNNIDSLKSTYTENIGDPLEEIGKTPPEIVVEPNLQTQIEDTFNDPQPVVQETVITTPPNPIITEDFDDPVFAALAEAEEAGLIELKTDHFEDPREFEKPSLSSTPTNTPTLNTLANSLAIDIDNVPTWDPQYTDTRIKTLHPNIRRSAKELILRCSIELDINLRIAGAYRSIAEQDSLYAQGRNGNSGQKVTNAKGGQSYHNFGLAFDLVEIKADKSANYEYDHGLVSNIGKNLGFEWGGDWKSIVDKPHYQMVFGLKTSELKIILDNNIAEGIALEGKYPVIST